MNQKVAAKFMKRATHFQFVIAAQDTAGSKLTLGIFKNLEKKSVDQR